MRRKAVAGAVLLGIVGAVLLWRGTRSDSPSKMASSDDIAVAGCDATAKPRAKSAPVKREPVGTLRLEGQVIDGKDSAPVGGATVMLLTDPPRTVTTEVDGSFTFDGLPARSYRVEAWKDAQYAPDATVRVTATTEPLVMRMKTGLSLEVHVRGDGREPIAGARVTVNERRETTTDHDGTAIMGGLEPAFFAEVQVTADGWSPASFTSPVPDDAGRTISHDVRLSRGAALAGTVVDPSGAPVAGAHVDIESLAMTTSVETDAGGAWQLPAIAAGRYELAAWADDYAHSESVIVDVDGRTPRRGVILRFRRGVEIAGVVVDAAGKPIAGARVVARARGSSSDANSGSDGRFVVRGLPPATYSVSASDSTRASPVASVDAKADIRDVRLVAVDGTIAGMVVDSGGTLVPEARVELMPMLGEPEIGPVEDIADAHGHFTLGPVPAGSYIVRAHWPGGDWRTDYTRLSDMTGDVLTARAGDRDVKVVLPASGTVTGVVTVDGAPLTHYGVAIHEPFLRSAAVASGTASNDGRFARRDVPTGTWAVTIVGDTIASHEIDGVEVTAGHVTDLGRIELHAGRVVRGRVTDAAGAAVEGAAVAIGATFTGGHGAFVLDAGPFDNPLHVSRLGTSDAKGGFALVVPDDDTRIPLRIAAMDAVRGRSPVLPLPANGDVELQLVATGSIEGDLLNVTVTDSMGVVARDASGATTIGSIDGAGHFVIDGLLPGTYQVSGEDLLGGTPTRAAEVTVTGGQTLHVNLSTGDISLIVHGAGVKCFLSLEAANSSQQAGPVRQCTGSDVTFADLDAGEYQLCRDTNCRAVTIAATPHEQTIDLSARK
jgi:hypothetical protein